MTPAARLAAAIEVLDAIGGGSAPAEEVLRAWGRAHRFAGSKDRRAIAERVYAVLRARTRLAWAMGGESGRALVIGALRLQDGLDLDRMEALADGQGYGPAPLTEDERQRLRIALQPPPDWIAAGLPAFAIPMFQTRFGLEWLPEAQALTGARAPLDLRVNALRGGVDQAMSLLAIDGVEPGRTPYSAWGLRLPADLAADVTRWRAFQTGWVEVQDEASQIAAALAGARPGMTVVDYCAGGGGKTLALGAAMRAGAEASPGARLIALDVNPKRLDAMAPRLARAGVRAEVRRIGSEGQGTEDLPNLADLVFVDAPCSGSGTWRRHPEGTWRVTAETVERLARQQLSILAQASALVKPGGRLAYATCSVLPAENEAVAAAFELNHPQFRPWPIARVLDAPDLTDAARIRLAELAGGGSRLQLTPHQSGTDGFFLALFERTA
ncbi:RsmB/NOP family class I SAM-dependent RNA methyltransferase [Caulobacter sp. S45]|uniref:RsmB/NOP family class I SAM-dependent RNA methyltransferase n=1 Tax=Caulobacter sp. S45 TaxID=1641861 RepID=UPI0015757908|nr:RsmB/NOP family class I SAM-dependent RNA methyltransferase [Caulobacter sp. S45]